MKRGEGRVVARFFAVMSKQEKITLVMFALASLGTVYLVWQLFLAQGTVSDGGGDIVSMFMSVSIFCMAAIQKFGNGPLEDERDLKIKAKGIGAGYFALVLLVVVTAAIFQRHGFADYLASLTPVWQEMYLLLCVVVSVAVNYVVRAYHYWRDRSATAQ